MKVTLDEVKKLSDPCANHNFVVEFDNESENNRSIGLTVVGIKLQGKNVLIKAMMTSDFNTLKIIKAHRLSIKLFNNTGDAYATLLNKEIIEKTEIHGLVLDSNTNDALIVTFKTKLASRRVGSR